MWSNCAAGKDPYIDSASSKLYKEYICSTVYCQNYGYTAHAQYTEDLHIYIYIHTQLSQVERCNGVSTCSVVVIAHV